MMLIIEVFILLKAHQNKLVNTVTISLKSGFSSQYIFIVTNQKTIQFVFKDFDINCACKLLSYLCTFYYLIFTNLLLHNVLFNLLALGLQLTLASRCLDTATSTRPVLRLKGRQLSGILSTGSAQDLPLLIPPVLPSQATPLRNGSLTNSRAAFGRNMKKCSGNLHTFHLFVR